MENEELLSRVSDMLDDRTTALEKRLEKKMDSRFEQVDSRFEKVDKRFEEVDKRFEQVDKRFEEVNKRFEEVDKHFEKVDKHLERVDKHLEKVDKHLEAIDKRFGEMEQHLDDKLQKTFEEMVPVITKTLTGTLNLLIENRIGKKIDALFEGYQLLYEKQEKQEHRIARLESDMDHVKPEIYALKQKLG